MENTVQIDKGFYRKVIALVLPMAIQNLINVGIQSADVIMLGKVSEKVLAGASIGGQISFILNLIFFGLTSGACILTAQYWGKNDTKAIEQVLSIALRISMAAGIVFFVLAQLMPYQLMRLFSNDKIVIEEAVKYLRIVSFSYVFQAITMIYLCIARSVERVLISTIVYATSFVLNVILNLIFIFGLLGAPKMGIRGAALATVIARAVELLVIICYSKFSSVPVRIRISDMFSFNKLLFKDFKKYSLPVVANELLWGAGTATVAAIIGQLSSEATAANSVAQVTRQLAMVINFGIANATAIIIGKAIGENSIKKAEEYGRRFLKMSIVAGICAGIFILILRPFIIDFVNLSDTAKHYLSVMMMVMSYFLAAQTLSTVLIVGIFRAGGDSKAALIIDIVGLWGFSITFGAIAAFVFKFPVLVVYVILLTDEIIKLPLIIYRYKKKIWLKNITR